MVCFHSGFGKSHFLDISLHDSLSPFIQCVLFNSFLIRTLPGRTSTTTLLLIVYVLPSSSSSFPLYIPPSLSVSSSSKELLLLPPTLLPVLVLVRVVIFIIAEDEQREGFERGKEGKFALAAVSVPCCCSCRWCSKTRSINTIRVSPGQKASPKARISS